MEGAENNLELVELRDATNLVPGWQVQEWWFYVAIFVILVAVILILLLKKKPKKIDTLALRKQAYLDAKKDFQNMEESGSRESAGKVSLILRRYLATAMQEPALFETHEEFVGRHDGLKSLPNDLRIELGGFFSRLASCKYSSDGNAGYSGSEMKSEGMEFLERAHRA